MQDQVQRSILELNLSRGMKGNSRYFCSYISNKRRLESTWAPFQGAWNVVTDVEKAEILSACFAFGLVVSTGR